MRPSVALVGDLGQRSDSGTREYRSATRTTVLRPATSLRHRPPASGRVARSSHSVEMMTLVRVCAKHRRQAVSGPNTRPPLLILACAGVAATAVRGRLRSGFAGLT